MSTVGGLVQSVRRLVFGTYRPTFNELTGALTDAVTVLTLKHPVQGVGYGTYLSVDDELVYVWSVSGSTITVMRGALGTTPEAHATGALVEINPRFPNILILDEAKAEISAWPRSLYRVDARTFQMGAGDTAVDLSGFQNFYTTLRCYQAPASSDRDRWPDLAHQWKRELPSTNFPSGIGLFLDRAAFVGQGYDIRVIAACGFDTSTFETTTDLQADVGLTEPLEDALKYGVGWRMLAGREAKRTFTEGQGEPRHAEEVPPMHQQQLAEQWRRIRNERITTEAARLGGDYGWRVMR